MNDITEMQQYQKGFLDKKEGKIGMGLALLGIGAVGYALLVNLPWFIALLTNIITAGALLAIIAIAIAVVWDGRLPAALWFMYQSGITRTLQALWRSDPISIAWSYIHNAKKKRFVLQEMISRVKGEVNKIAKTITDNKKEIEQNLAGAKKAQQIGEQTEYLLRSRKAGRRNESNVSYEAALKTLDNMYKTLIRMDQITGLVIEDTEDQIHQKTTLFTSMRSAATAFGAVKDIIRGDKNKKFMFDGAMEFMQEDIANKVGEIESFLDMSKDFFNGIDIDNAIFEDKGQKMLDEWINGSKLLGADEKKQLEFAGVNAGKKSTSAYANLLD